MTILMTPRQVSSITLGSTDLIGRAALLYHAGHKIHPIVAEGYFKDMDIAFEAIAAALGYRVEKIEATAQAAE